MVGTRTERTAARGHPPAVGGGVDDALLDQPLDQFLDVVRVAVGGADHQVDQGRRHVVGPLQDLGDQAPRVVVRERVELQPGVHRTALPPGRPLLQQGRAGPWRGRAAGRRRAPGPGLRASPCSRSRPSAGPPAAPPPAPARRAGRAAAGPARSPPPQRLRIEWSATALRPSSPTANPSQVATVSGAPSSASSCRAAGPSPRRHFWRTRSGASVARMPRRSANMLRSRAFGTFSVDGEARPRSTQTSVGSRASHVSMSCTSRDLPTPASPSTVTIRRARSLHDGGEGVLELAQMAARGRWCG